MSNIFNAQTNSTSPVSTAQVVAQDYDLQNPSLAQQEADIKFGLYIPEGESEEVKEYWRQFNFLMRNGIIDNVIHDYHIYRFQEKFSKAENKQDYINDLIKKIQDAKDFKPVSLATIRMQERREKIMEAAKLVPFDKLPEFFKKLSQDQEMDAGYEDFIAELEKETELMKKELQASNQASQSQEEIAEIQEFYKTLNDNEKKEFDNLVLQYKLNDIQRTPLQAARMEAGVGFNETISKETIQSYLDKAGESNLSNNNSSVANTSVQAQQAGYQPTQFVNRSNVRTMPKSRPANAFTTPAPQVSQPSPQQPVNRVNPASYQRPVSPQQFNTRPVNTYPANNPNPRPQQFRPNPAIPRVQQPLQRPSIGPSQNQTPPSSGLDQPFKKKEKGLDQLLGNK